MNVTRLSLLLCTWSTTLVTSREKISVPWPLFFGTPQRSKHLDEEHPLYLAIDSIGFLSSAAEQSPSFVLDIADVDVVAVAFPEGDPGAPEHEEVVAM